jgi:hypothetical protein
VTDAGYEGLVGVAKQTIERSVVDGPGDGRIEAMMDRAGVTQKELGEHLGCTQQFLSKVATRKRRWPPAMRERAEAYLGGKERLRRTSLTCSRRWTEIC